MAGEIFSAWFFQLALVAVPVVVLGYPVLLWFHLVKKWPRLMPAARRALSLALVALPVGAALMARAMLSSRSSTAAVGLAVVPLLAAMLAAIVFVVVWALGYLIGALLPTRQETNRQPHARLRLFLAFVVVAGVALPAAQVLRREWLARQVSSPRASIEDLRQLFNRPAVQRDPWLLSQLAARPDIPPDLLLELARDPRKDLGKAQQPWLRRMFFPAAEPRSVWGAVARNPRAPAAALWELAGRPKEEVAEGVAANPATPVAALPRLLRSPHPEVLGALASNPRTSPDLLARLAERSEIAVRAKVAANPKTPSASLGKLASDPDQWVRLAVASNPSAAPETLLLLARDPVAEVRGFVATNPSTPDAALNLLIADPDERVRRYATQRADASHAR